MQITTLQTLRAATQALASAMEELKDAATFDAACKDEAVELSAYIHACAALLAQHNIKHSENI